MKKYYRVVLGKQHVYAEKFFNENSIGLYYNIDQYLIGHLP